MFLEDGFWFDERMVDSVTLRQFLTVYSILGSDRVSLLLEQWLADHIDTWCGGTKDEWTKLYDSAIGGDSYVS